MADFEHLVAMIEQITTKVEAHHEKMYANQGETDATLREMRAGQELLKEDMLAKLHAHLERMMARMDSQLVKMVACLGKTEVMIWR
jgi:hypothetical protein